MATSIASLPPPEPPGTTETSPLALSQTPADQPTDSASNWPAETSSTAPAQTPADPPRDPSSNPPPEPPLLVNSISEMKSLTLAVTAFQQCYDELIHHLHSIRSSITAILPSQVSEIPNSSHPQQNPSPHWPGSEKKAHDHRNSEFASLNKALCGKNLRKYVITHLNDVQKLREEVPQSLKLATNPSKLVLDSLGKFYLQGKKAFEKDSPMIASREASIFMLECFLLMMGLYENEVSMDADRSVIDKAEAVAVTWKKRLVSEGGLAYASEVDARGLLLFIACFGVPASFRRMDVRDLALAGNGKEVSGLLRKSRKFVDKMIDIVKELLRIKMEVDAVDMIYTFGLEELFNPRTILLTYLKESKASWTSPKQASPLEGKKKKLAVLKSICKCLEKHNVDPAKILPGWQVTEHIDKLEKTIAESNRKTITSKKPAQKRKPSRTEPSSSKKPKPQNPTWSSYLSHVPPPQQPKHTSQVINYSAPPILYREHGTSSLEPSVAAASLPSSHANVYSMPNYYGGIASVDMSEQGMINHGSYQYQWQADAVLVEKYAAGQSSSLYPAPEGFGGVANNVVVASSASDIYQLGNNAVVAPSAGVVNQISDLYQFGNNEIEQQPSTVVAQHPYLYQV